MALEVIGEKLAKIHSHNRWYRMTHTVQCVDFQEQLLFHSMIDMDPNDMYLQGSEILVKVAKNNHAHPIHLDLRPASLLDGSDDHHQ